MEVVLIAAQSLDGRITRHEEPGVAFVSPTDHAWFPACLREFDACIMGAATYRQARADIATGLTRVRRRRVVLTHQPENYSGEAVTGQLEFSGEAPLAVVQRLRDDGVRRCALLGGAEINGAFFAAGLVDALWLTIEPRLFGAGRPLAAGRFDVPLHLLAVTPLGADVLLVKYAVAPPPVAESGNLR